MLRKILLCTSPAAVKFEETWARASLAKYKPQILTT